jgi:hypothetical protein
MRTQHDEGPHQGRRDSGDVAAACSLAASKAAKTPDRVGVPHGAAAIGRKAVAGNVDRVDVCGALSESLGENARASLIMGERHRSMISSAAIRLA